jgi:integrase/recombinase XerD
MFTRFEDKYGDYLLHLEKEGRKAKTIAEHKKFLYEYFPESLRRKWLSSVSRADIDILKEVGRQHGEHGATRMVVTLRRYFDFMQSHLGMKMPFDWRDIRVPVVRQKEQPVFEDHELATLFQVMETMEAGSVHGRRMAWTMQAFFETLFGTGLRIHEALRLNRIDLNSIKESGRLMVLRKGGKTCEVSFSERAIKKLEEYYGRRNDTNDAMFVNSCGERLIMATARSYFERLKRKLRDTGYPEIAAKLKSHTFRRTLATYLIENGADIKSVQTIMDHESERTTVKHYIRVNKKRAQLIHHYILSRFSVDELASRCRETGGRVQVRMTENQGRWMTLRNDEISPDLLAHVKEQEASLRPAHV